MYLSRVGRPILMSSWTLTDSTTVASKPAAWIWSTTSLISASSQISPGILLCRAQTISSTPGICLMSLRVMGSLPSPYQRQPIFIDMWCSFCLYSRLRRGEACLARKFPVANPRAGYTFYVAGRTCPAPTGRQMQGFPPWGKLSSKMTDEGEPGHCCSLTGQLRKLTPHPALRGHLPP